MSCSAVFVISCRDVNYKLCRMARPIFSGKSKIGDDTVCKCVCVCVRFRHVFQVLKG